MLKFSKVSSAIVSLHNAKRVIKEVHQLSPFPVMVDATLLIYDLLSALSLDPKCIRWLLGSKAWCYLQDKGALPFDGDPWLN